MSFDRPAGQRSLEQQNAMLRTIRDLLSAVLTVPRLWAFGLIIAALGSTISVGRNRSGSYGAGFSVTWITALLFALVWLPALLRVIGLVGGSLKTPAGEATTGGLISFFDRMNPSARQDVLATTIAALDQVDLGHDPSARQLRTELESELAKDAPAEIEPLLEGIAQRYEELRDTRPPGDERTFLMTRLVGEARAAAQSLAQPEGEAWRYFDSARDGYRVIALAIAQVHPSPTLFDLVIQAVSDSRSAFEQFHALRALDALLPSLSRMQRGQASEVLVHQRSPSGWITPEDPSRWEYSAYLLDELGA